jgi:hypothetical protein
MQPESITAASAVYEEDARKAKFDPTPAEEEIAVQDFEDELPPDNDDSFEAEERLA